VLTEARARSGADERDLLRPLANTERQGMRATGPLVERLPIATMHFNLYVGLFLRNHDDRARAKESFAEH
jgi:hypothetical protein